MKANVRVTMNGNEARWELMVEGRKVADLSYLETLELAMQATSSLRWVNRPREIPAKQ